MTWHVKFQQPTFPYPLHTHHQVPPLSSLLKKKARGNGSRIQRTLHRYQSIDQFPGLFKAHHIPVLQCTTHLYSLVLVSRNAQDNISDQ